MATSYQAERLAGNLRKVRDKAEEIKKLLSGAEAYAKEMMNKEQQAMFRHIELQADEVREMAHRLQKACANGLAAVTEQKRMPPLNVNSLNDGIIQPEGT